jgi:hypothetical protein
MKTTPFCPYLSLSTSHSSDTPISFTEFAFTNFSYTSTTIPTVLTTPVYTSCALSGVGHANTATYHNIISWTTASFTWFTGAWAAHARLKSEPAMPAPRPLVPDLLASELRALKHSVTPPSPLKPQQCKLHRNTSRTAIPPAPPMSIYLPFTFSKVICCHCLCNSHMSYKKCSDCYINLTVVRITKTSGQFNH